MIPGERRLQSPDKESSSKIANDRRLQSPLPRPPVITFIFSRYQPYGSLVKGSMRRTNYLVIVLLAIVILLPSVGVGANRTSVGLSVGTGFPVGWWGERWGPFQSSEINLHYEFGEGTGFMIFTGLSKSYLASMSSRKVMQESRNHDQHSEFDPYATITRAYQGGSFKQLPVGFGFYQEMDLAGFRAYGSAAFAIYLWKFERSQVFEETVMPPSHDTLYYRDNWWDEQDGSNVGLQFGAGVIYPLQTGVLLDLSLAYHFVSLSSDNAAIAYWGKPARTWDSNQKASAKTNADFLLVNLGVRFGK